MHILMSAMAIQMRPIDIAGMKQSAKSTCIAWISSVSVRLPGSSRVFRGGGWYYVDALGCRVAHRGYVNAYPDYAHISLGFRACLPPGQ
jgi:formylglycine-generating enzyme required for sulfatase activity